MTRPNPNTIDQGDEGWDAPLNDNFDLIFVDPAPLGEFTTPDLPDPSLNDLCVAVDSSRLELVLSDGTAWKRTETREKTYDSVTFADSPFTADASHHILLCDATSGNITINLDEAANCDGLILVFKKTDSTANTVTVDGDGSETIDGSTTNVLSSQWDVLTILCDGSNWLIV